MERIEVGGMVYEFEDGISLMMLLDENADRVYESVSTNAPPPNDPLTLEELREMWKMDGDPAYLDFGGVGEWVLVQLRMNEIFFLHKNGISAPAENAFRIGGKVYRRKPEPET